MTADELSDVFEEYVDGRLRTDPVAFVDKAAVYDDFTRWAAEHEVPQIDAAWFGRLLKAHFGIKLRIYRRSTPEGRVMAYRGIRFTKEGR